MRRRTALATATALLLLFGPAAEPLAQTSENYDATESRVAGGGGESQSADYRVQGVVGQWVSATSASPNYRIVAKFFVPEPETGLLGYAALTTLAGLAGARRGRGARLPRGAGGRESRR